MSILCPECHYTNVNSTEVALLYYVCIYYCPLYYTQCSSYINLRGCSEPHSHFICSSSKQWTMRGRSWQQNVCTQSCRILLLLLFSSVCCSCHILLIIDCIVNHHINFTSIQTKLISLVLNSGYKHACNRAQILAGHSNELMQHTYHWNFDFVLTTWTSLSNEAINVYRHWCSKPCTCFQSKHSQTHVTPNTNQVQEEVA